MAERHGQYGEEATQITTSLLQSSLRIDPAGSKAGPIMVGAPVNVSARKSSSPATGPSQEHGLEQATAGLVWLDQAAPAASRLQQGATAVDVTADRAFTDKLQAALERWKEPEWSGTVGKVSVFAGFLMLVLAGVALAAIGTSLLASRQTAAGKKDIDPWSTMYMVMHFTVWESISSDQYITNIGLLQQDLGGSYQQMSLSVLEIAAVKALAGLLIGVVSDHIGRRRTILFFLGLMPISTLACGLAPDARWYLAARFLQGVAGGGAVAVSGVIRDVFPVAEERGSAFGTFSMVIMTVPLVTPSLGTLLAATIGWRGVFLVLVLGISASWLHLYVSLPETLVISPSIRSTYWNEAAQLLGNYQLMSLVFAIATAYAPGSLMRAHVPRILEDLHGVTPLQMAFFLGVCSAMLCAGFALAGTLSTSWGMLPLFRFGTAVQILPVVCFTLCGLHLSSSVRALLGAQLLHQMLVGLFCMSANILYMQPLEDVYALAEGLRMFVCIGLSPLLVSLPDKVLVGSGTAAAKSYSLFSAGCILASLASAWLCFVSHPPEYALEDQRKFKGSGEANCEATMEDESVTLAKQAVKPAAALLEKKS